ncbi:MAG: hypothetical protein H6668_19740 [Ardenticatenaceae bacterium]|nr:hypothetical protein [Ardenticatenaceae bacterium]
MIETVVTTLRRTSVDRGQPAAGMHHFRAFACDGQIAVVGGYTGVCCDDSEFGLDHLFLQSSQR